MTAKLGPGRAWIPCVRARIAGESGWSRILSTARRFPFVRQIDDASRDTSSNDLEKTTHAFTPRVPIEPRRWYCPRSSSSCLAFPFAPRPHRSILVTVLFRFRHGSSSVARSSFFPYRRYAVAFLLCLRLLLLLFFSFVGVFFFVFLGNSPQRCLPNGC